MSGKSVTDRRIGIELKKLDLQMCDIYESSFGTFLQEAADEGVWEEELQAWILLMKRLSPRPLGLMEIRRACSAYTVAFRRACEAGRQRAR